MLFPQLERAQRLLSSCGPAELLTAVLSCEVLPVIACLEGHHIASIYSKRFRSRLDTGDHNTFFDCLFG
jgi:hypothetical protein